MNDVDMDASDVAVTPVDDRCGTYAGVSAHNYRGEPLCDECQAARTRYTATIRARTGDLTNRSLSLAKNRALYRLAKHYPTEFAALTQAELPAATEYIRERHEAKHDVSQAATGGDA